MRVERRRTCALVAGAAALAALAALVVGAPPGSATPVGASQGPADVAPIVGSAPTAAASALTVPATWDPYVVTGTWGREAEAASFVNALYHDLFDRLPDPAAGHWQMAIYGGATGTAVADVLTSSAEYRTHLLSDTYQRFLGRGPDAAGLAGWLRAMTSGLTIEQVQSGFIASDEYYAAAGATGPGWVTRLYADVLDRSAAPSEVSAWVAALRRGASRSEVAMGFLLSTENLTTVVDGYYLELLGRHIDATGRRGWVRLIQQGARDEQIVSGIVASPEYWRTTAEAARIVVTPASSTVRVGETQAYRALAYDVDGVFIRDVTYRTDFGTGGARCGAEPSCTIAEVGEHTVLGVSGAAGGTSVLRVVPAGLDHLVVSPATATVASGASVRFRAEAVDASGNALGDVTFAATFAVEGEAGACVGAVCAPVALGSATVTATVLDASGTATIEVLEAGPPGARLFSWASGGYDEYGLRQVTASDVVQLEADTHWAEVAAGHGFVLGLKTDGTLWGWGDNDIGQLGFLPAGDVPYPTQLNGDRDWVHVFAESSAGAALKADGTLWTWGGVNRPAPAALTNPPGPWRDVAPGGGHWLAVHADGSLWGWGYGNRGQLGTGAPTNVSQPVRVGTGNDWVSVDAAFNHSFGLRADGSLWAWGFNSEGQLGIGSTDDAFAPTRVGTGTWVSVAADDFTTVAIASDGSLWTWGASNSGQIGDGMWEQRTSPTLIAPAGAAPWVTADIGFSWGVGTRSDGTLWIWGAGFQTPWGPVPPDRLRPRQLGTGTQWRSVVIGGITNDGGLILAD